MRISTIRRGRAKETVDAGLGRLLRAGARAGSQLFLIDLAKCLP